MEVEDVGSILGFMIMAFMLAALFVAVATWPAMLLLGIAHSYDAIIPALGFRGLFCLGLALRLLLSLTGKLVVE